jgi:hypothetical protein
MFTSLPHQIIIDYTPIRITIPSGRFSLFSPHLRHSRPESLTKKDHRDGHALVLQYFAMVLR